MLVGIHVSAPAVDAAKCARGLFPASGQTSASPADRVGATLALVPEDGVVRAGAPLTYKDNRDGTITDLNTGLMWEKKSNDYGLHDKDLRLPWSSFSGPTIWDWLDQVNAEGGTGFARYQDWRIPNVKELQSIIDFEEVNPAVQPVFNNRHSSFCTVLTCSYTGSDEYWSSTAGANSPPTAWLVDFLDGFVRVDLKGNPNYVRAVRGGCLN